MDDLKAFSDRIQRLRKVFIIVRRGYEHDPATDNEAWDKVLRDINGQEASYLSYLLLLRCGWRRRRHWTREAEEFCLGR